MPDKLAAGGFRPIGRGYVYETTLPNTVMKAVVEVDGGGAVSGRVIDTESADEYTAFRVEGVSGKFANTVREEYTKLLRDIRKRCFANFDFVFDLLR